MRQRMPVEESPDGEQSRYVEGVAIFTIGGANDLFSADFVRHAGSGISEQLRSSIPPAIHPAMPRTRSRSRRARIHAVLTNCLWWSYQVVHTLRVRWQRGLADR